MKDDNDNNVTVNDAECQILADDNANAITDSIGATKTMDGSGAEDNIKAQSKKEDDLLLPAKIESTKTVDGNDSEDNIKTKSKKEDDILLPTKAESTDATNR